MTVPTLRSLPKRWATPRAPARATGLVLSPLPLTGAAASVLRKLWGHLVDLDGPQGVALAFDAPDGKAPWAKEMGDTPIVHDLGAGCGLVVGPAGEALAFHDLKAQGTGDHCVLVPIPLRLIGAPTQATQAWIAAAPLRASFIGKGAFPIWGGVQPATTSAEEQLVRAIRDMVDAGKDLYQVEDCGLQGVRHPAADGWTTAQPGRLEWERGRNPPSPRASAFQSLMDWAARGALDRLPVRHYAYAGKTTHRGFVEDARPQRANSAHARTERLHTWMAHLQASQRAWAKVFPEFQALLEATP
jgi:hypothetical protein